MESIGTEINIEEDILKEILSSTALNPTTGKKHSPVANRDIKIII